ncbi:MAG: hypothetical protein LBT64_01875 [Puniceicoccales bacterium]|nr:hypothetical protein [Puniceicoccales bacterium]
MFTIDAHGMERPCRKSRPLGIKSVTVRQFSDSDFKTASEYFRRGKEYQYFRCIARNDKTKRAGTYFIVELNKSVVKLPQMMRAKISTIKSPADGVRVFFCEIPNNNRSSMAYEIYCGITSGGLHADEINAWKVELIDQSEKAICSRCSYMWDL